MGFDKVPPKMVKLGVQSLCTHIMFLIKMCIDKCVFPSCIKKANVTPIHKKGVLHNKEIFFTDRWVFYLISLLPYFKDIRNCIDRPAPESLFFSFFRSIYQGLGKATAARLYWQILLKHVSKNWMRNNMPAAYSQKCPKHLIICRMAFLLGNLQHIMFITTPVHCWSFISVRDGKE